MTGKFIYKKLHETGTNGLWKIDGRWKLLDLPPTVQKMRNFAFESAIYSIFLLNMKVDLK
ncbi:hypothetical protein B6A27_05355 [Anoxybacillus sp. UARK-01]|nr:hypothetical protein B6A27_05355 [Anoxybacillus sp. UARK-01]